MSFISEPSLLFSTEQGSAVHCSCCGRVEVSFGNAVLALDPEQLGSVVEIIDSFDLEPLSSSGEGMLASERYRPYLIRTQHDDAAFAFSRREALELREILHGASTALRVRFRSAPAGAPDPHLWLH